jgi:hypothetical protein
VERGASGEWLGTAPCTSPLLPVLFLGRCDVAGVLGAPLVVDKGLFARDGVDNDPDVAIVEDTVGVG